MRLKASIQHLFQTLFAISKLDIYTYLSRKLRHLGNESSFHHNQLGELSYYLVFNFVKKLRSKFPSRLTVLSNSGCLRPCSPGPGGQPWKVSMSKHRRRDLPSLLNFWGPGQMVSSQAHKPLLQSLCNQAIWPSSYPGESQDPSLPYPTHWRSCIFRELPWKGLAFIHLHSLLALATFCIPEKSAPGPITHLQFQYHLYLFV